MAYTLRSAPASPFARKVRIGAHVVGLIDDIAIEGGPSGEGDVIYQQNPLGKIPVLVTDDGQAIYDSPVILEYLDAVTTPGSLIPTEIGARFDALRLQSLGDGILDAAGVATPPTSPTSSGTWIPASASNARRCNRPFHLCLECSSGAPAKARKDTSGCTS